MFNPFAEKPILLGDAVMDWKTIYPKPYDKTWLTPYQSASFNERH